MTRDRALLAAAFVALALGAAPAVAGEGNGEAFPSPSGGWTTAARLRPVAADVGSEQQYNPSDRPGTGLPLSAELLPASGSEGVVQTANSGPPRFEDGTAQFAQTRNIQASQAAQFGRATTIAADWHHGAGPQG